MKILHISDTHGCHRRLQDLPDANVLVHSGDFTMNGTESEAIDFMNWLCDLPYAHKIFICGNHDECLYGANIDGLPSDVHYLCNSGVEIDGVKFYGVPMFMADCITDRQSRNYARIPADTNVLITHTPPYGILDFDDDINYGSEEILSRIEAIKPRLHLFGHIHQHHGITTIGSTTFSNAAIMNSDYSTLNLRKVQAEKEFNSIGELEIPYESLIEYVVNALVHRSLNIKSPIRIFIFDNRVEIHSPGTLPNGMTIEDIKKGTSLPRNMFLFTNANYLLPYTGAGSGVRRALEYDPNVIFFNGVEDKEITHAANEFVITIPRKSNQAQSESNQATEKSNQVIAEHEYKSNQAERKSNQPRVNLITRKLTKKEEDIRNFCSVPRSAQEIMDRLKISNQSKNRQKYITSLIEIGVLERTIPEKPNDPNQKYRRKK